MRSQQSGSMKAYEVEFKNKWDAWERILTVPVLEGGVPYSHFAKGIFEQINLFSYESAMAIAWGYMAFHPFTEVRIVPHKLQYTITTEPDGDPMLITKTGQRSDSMSKQWYCPHCGPLNSDETWYCEHSATQCCADCGGDTPVTDCPPFVTSLQARIAELEAIIKVAPHHNHCNVDLLGPSDTCDCWKSKIGSK
jgi:hypothetical protein